MYTILPNVTLNREKIFYFLCEKKLHWKVLSEKKIYNDKVYNIICNKNEKLFPLSYFSFKPYVYYSFNLQIEFFLYKASVFALDFVDLMWGFSDNIWTPGLKRAGQL